MILNCIAVDDEPLALQLIVSFIEETPFLNLLAAHGSAVEALETLRSENVHVVFLDIQMPKLNGMTIARFLHQSGMQSKIIFTTAYGEFAVDSYQVEAIDYLLKPFEYENFLAAAKKALNFYELRNQLEAVSTPSRERFIYVKVGYQSVKVRLEDITYLESQKDYVKIHLNNSEKPIVTLATLKSLEKKLPENLFMRVQRSFIVSMDKVNAATKSSLWIGDFEINIGERYRNSVRIALNKRERPLDNL